MDTSGLTNLLQRADRLRTDLVSTSPASSYGSNIKQLADRSQKWQKSFGKPSGIEDESSVGGLGLSMIDDRMLDTSMPHKQSNVLGSSRVQSQSVNSSEEMPLAKFLREERERTIMTLIDNSLTQSTEDARKNNLRTFLDDWGEYKKKLMSCTPSVSITPQEAHSFRAGVVPGSRSSMTQVQLAFASTMAQLTDKELQGGTRPMFLHAFKDTAEKLNDTNQQFVWDQLKSLSGLNVSAGCELLAERATPTVQKHLIQLSLAHLEKNFRDHMRCIVQGNLDEARLGGVPGTSRLIIAFLNIIPTNHHIKPDEIYEGHSVWTILYMCIRAGDAPAALEISSQFGAPLSEMTAVLKEYISRNKQLSLDVISKLRLQYRRSLRSDSDSYKRALYCILAPCDVSLEQNDVSDKFEDWLWMCLVQATHVLLNSEDVERKDGAIGSLEHLIKLLSEDYGEQHFSGGEVSLYWTGLWLTGQFESAIEYLWRQGEMYKPHAVHAAIGFNQLGLLATPTNIQAKLITSETNDPKGSKRLNVARMVMMYASKFEASDPREAINYYHAIKSFRSPAGESLFAMCVSRLVLETKEYELMLGRIANDGTKIPGLIEKYSFDSKELIEYVAKESENKGLLDVAVNLYDLAGNHSRCLSLLSSMLSQVASQPSGQGSERDRYRQLCARIGGRYQSQGCSAEASIASTFFLLMDIITLFDLCRASKNREALEVNRKLRLIPTESDEVDAFVKNFFMVPEEVRNVLGELLICMMNCVQSEYSILRGNSSYASTNAGLERSIHELRDQGQAVLLYAGMLPYRLPAKVTAQLVSIEANLH